MAQTFDKTDNYIISESKEISLGQSNKWVEKIFSLFPAFRHKSFQLYFAGQLISLIGTWLQMVAEGWLVYQLTHSPFLVGLTSMMSTLPFLIFSLFGGVIVDRFPKRKILFFTQISAMILAFILGILTITNLINIYEILILAFLLGIVSALDAPARQSFAIEMVGKKDLTSAIALSSGIFNGARVIGPAMAGVAIAVVGTGGTFILNGLSYIAALIAIFLIHVETIVPKNHPHPIKAIKEGISYSLSNPIIKFLLIFTGVNSIFGMSYFAIMPVLAEKVFHQNAAGLGMLYSISGLGSILGTVFISAFSKKINEIKLIIIGNFIFIFSLMIFTFIKDWNVALLFMFISGFGAIMQFATINSSIQHLVNDEIRGRIMSIYVLMFMGLIPFGSLQIGFFAEHFGPLFAIRLGLLITLAFGIFLFLKRDKIQKAYNDSR